MDESKQSKGGKARAELLSPEDRQRIASEGGRARAEAAALLPKVEYSGILRLGDASIPCAVLNDGSRVLSETGIAEAILGGRSGASKRLKKASQESGALLPLFVAPSQLKPFIDSALAEGPLKPIYYLDGRRIFVGYDPRILRAVCEIWLRAREAKALQKQQLDKAQRAEALMRALADIGLIALVDEATGYQQVRARDELQRILAAYVSPDLMPYTSRFPQNFYSELHRVRGWKYAPGSNKRNHYIGKLTNELIYKQLPEGVLDNLRKKNPILPDKKRRKNLHYKYLTEDVGDPHLQKQIVAVTTLLSVADDWKEFSRLFSKRFRPQSGDLFALPPPKDDEDPDTESV
ncbi:P63C domain-containing protein [Methylocapsa acidiphila]|uniref:P63C domain-containing protein n=1 Tax=Methylocapsa acidiphila TaxID=133552 RepID=UPI00047B6D53|nr:P63C domain-containing protein [Methylocapsa acidiphila]